MPSDESGPALSAITLAQIEATTRCNFTCGYCCGRQMPQKDLEFKTFTAILDALPGLQHIELQGEGEPMLHARFFDMIAHARGRGIHVSFISNGSYLDDARVNGILDLGVSKIAVSIDTANIDLFREIRGGDLNQIISGIRRLMSRRRERKLDRPIVGLQIPLLRKTLKSFPDIVRLYRELDLDGGFSVQTLMTMDAYVAVYDQRMIDQLLSRGEVEQFYSEHQHLFDEMLPQRRMDIPGYYDELFSGWDPRSGTCPWLEKAVYITWNGEYRPCCTIKDIAAYGFPAAEFHPRRMATIRNSLASSLRKGHVPAACRGCGIANKIAAIAQT